MLKVDQIEEIRRAYFIEGKGICRIAREGHHDRRTVRKALRDAGPPHYVLGHPRARPVLGRFVSIIDGWLAEDETRPPKQHHTARRIYHRLAGEHDYSGGESTVREYVRKRRPGDHPMFIPLAYQAAEDAESREGCIRPFPRATRRMAPKGLGVEALHPPEKPLV